MKRITAALLLCLVLCLCAGCGKEEAAVSVSEAFVTPTPEPTEEPAAEATPEPAEEPEEAEPVEEEPEEEPEEEEPAPQQSTNTAPAQSQPQSQPDPTPAPTEAPTPAPDPRDVALGLIGQDVNALIAAVGEPYSSNYLPSCINMNGAMDGYLDFGTFAVYTVRYADGFESILDVE